MENRSDFMKERRSGILLPVFSLPSPGGIGTLGKEAGEFISFLKAAGQTYWQILPVGPTGYGDSPYQALSSFAGNPYFIDPELLRKEKLLSKKDMEALRPGRNPERIDYGLLYRQRISLLKKAYRKGFEKEESHVRAFGERHRNWIYDYAMFMTMKQECGGAAWNRWPDPGVRDREPEAMGRFWFSRQEEIFFWVYIQYLFFRQWERLRKRAAEAGVRIIGDLPIYVPYDSADVWAGRNLFRLDEAGRPEEVAGCPPDYFSADGQLWGNPLYDWPVHRETGYDWWVRRLSHCAALFDVVRIDHFRGFESYYAIPAGSRTARSGVWKKGPGLEVFEAFRKQAGGEAAVIAEDLGDRTEAVEALLDASGFPGMRVLQFAFEAGRENGNLPHRHKENCVVYTGTHDNPTLRQYLSSEKKKNLDYARAYLRLTEEEGYARGFLKAAWASPAAAALAPLQDFLGTGKEGRINEPATERGNWAWRMKPGLLTRELAAEIREMTVLYGRAKPSPPRSAGDSSDPGCKSKRKKER